MEIIILCSLGITIIAIFVWMKFLLNKIKQLKKEKMTAEYNLKGVEKYLHTIFLMLNNSYVHPVENSIQKLKALENLYGYISEERRLLIYHKYRHANISTLNNMEVNVSSRIKDAINQIEKERKKDIE